MWSLCGAIAATLRSEPAILQKFFGRWVSPGRNAMLFIMANGSGPMNLDSWLHKRATASADERKPFARANVV